MGRDEMARIARRYDTLMARAMLRALGLKPRPTKAERLRRAANPTEREVRQCLGQRYGVRGL